MPELPDLVHVAKVLSAALVGRDVAGARTGDPTVLRMMVPGDFGPAVVGRTVRSIERRGHFMRFALGEDRVLVVNAMLVGKYRLLAPEEAAREKDPVALGFALAFDDGRELRYVDDKRMGKVYVATPADEARIPVYAALGVDVLSPSFDRARFAELARRRRDQVRPFLMDKTALASIGNAYADEILFEARLHPKTFVRTLSAEDRERLFVAIGTVLRTAIDEIARRNEPPEVKVRDFLAVRGRAGKPCPRCGTTIREVRVGDGDACFCPTCQPPTRSLFVDWSRVSEPDPTASPEGENPVTARTPPAAGGAARPRRRSRR
jgi:formamidopyrimidine-DNA glycosylase